MKKWLLIPFLCLSISLQAGAQSLPVQFESEPILLNYDQFSQLTHAEQKTYVKRLRELMIEVAQAFPEIAADLSARSNFYALLWESNVSTAFSKKYEIDDEALAGYALYANQQATMYLKEIESEKTSDLTVKEKSELTEKYRQALYWSAASAIQANAINKKRYRRQIISESVEPVRKLIERTEEKVKKFASEEEYSYARDTYFKKAHDGKLNRETPFPEGAWINYGDRLGNSIGFRPSPETPPAPKKEEKPVVQEDKKEDKKEEKKVEKKEEKAESQEEKIASLDKPVLEKPASEKPVAGKAEGEAKPKTVNNSFYRCMYAGFVIKNHPCIGPNKLPWDIKGLDENKFVCKSGAILCNPLLFGFKATCDWSKADDPKAAESCFNTAEPFCVSKGLYATKKCGEASNSDAALESAVRLIHNDPATFNLYSKSFDDLCNKNLINFNSYEGQRLPKNTERTKNDIKRTCDGARKRMADLKKRYTDFKESQKPKAPVPFHPPYKLPESPVSPNPNKGKK